MIRITDTVKSLLIINVIFFVGKLSLGGWAYDLLALWFPQNENFRFWQILTHMFMHGDEFHIFFNMFALFMFGSHLERSIGQRNFLFLYFSSGLGAAGLQILFTYFKFLPGYEALIAMGLSPSEITEFINNSVQQGRYAIPEGMDVDTVRSMIDAYRIPMVGASGAIFGVLAAFAVMYPNLPLMILFIPIPIKAKYLIGGYFLMDLYGGITGQALLGPSNVAHWAHIGGAVVGFITMWYWKKNSFNQNRWN